ncbi:hypothetical protein [Streptomyces sp. NPDC055287]
MRTMAQQGLKLHRPEHCLALAGWGRAKGRVDARGEALFAVTHTHALAKTGRRRQAVADVGRAHTALAVVGSGVVAAGGRRPLPNGQGLRDPRRLR